MLIAIYIAALFITYFLYNLTIPLYSRSGQLLEPLGASTLYLLVGMFTMGMMILAGGENVSISMLLRCPWYVYANGIANVMVLAGMILLLPRVGMGIVWATGTVGQFAASQVLDCLNFSGTGAIPITLERLLAVGIILVGSALFTRQSKTAAGTITKAGKLPLWLAIMVGTLIGIMQSLMNGVNTIVGMQMGTNQAVFIYLAIGAASTLLVCVLRQPATVIKIIKTHPKYYIPGVVNVLIVGLPVVIVPILGIGLYTGVFFLASSTSSILFDSMGIMGMPKIKMSISRVLGALAMLVGVLMLT